MNYYIEHPNSKVFAIIEAEFLDLVKAQDDEVFIRPMEDAEVWDDTIAHETSAGKRYVTIDDEEDVESFFEY